CYIALHLFTIRDLAHPPLLHELSAALVNIGTMFAKNTFTIDHEAVFGFRTVGKNQPCTGDIGCASTEENNPQILNILPNHLCCVDQTSESHGRRALLIIMPDRYFGPFA